DTMSMDSERLALRDNFSKFYDESLKGRDVRIGMVLYSGADDLTCLRDRIVEPLKGEDPDYWFRTNWVVPAPELITYTHNSFQLALKAMDCRKVGGMWMSGTSGEPFL